MYEKKVKNWIFNPYSRDNINLSRPNPGGRQKNKLKFLFSHFFVMPEKLNSFEEQQRSVKIKIYVNLYLIQISEMQEAVRVKYERILNLNLIDFMLALPWRRTWTQVSSLGETWLPYKNKSQVTRRNSGNLKAWNTSIRRIPLVLAFPSKLKQTSI